MLRVHFFGKRSNGPLRHQTIMRRTSYSPRVIALRLSVLTLGPNYAGGKSNSSVRLQSQARLPEKNNSSGEPAASITLPRQDITDCSISSPRSSPREKRAVCGSRQSWSPQMTREVIEDQCAGKADQTETQGQLRGRGPAQGSSLVSDEETRDMVEHRGRDVKHSRAFETDNEGISSSATKRLPAVDVETWDDIPRSCTGSNVSVPNAFSVESDSRQGGQGGENESVRHCRAPRGKASEKKRATAHRRKGDNLERQAR